MSRIGKGVLELSTAEPFLAVPLNQLNYDVLDYEDQCRCLQEAAVETLCKTGRHVGVQINSIRRFCRLTTPSARGLYNGQNLISQWCPYVVEGSSV